MLWLLAASPAIASAIPLAPPLFDVLVQGNGTGGLVNDHLTEIVPFSYDSGLQTSRDGGMWQVSFSLTGGPAPMVQTDGFELPATRNPLLDKAIGTIGYAVRVDPLPAYSALLANLPVPVTVSGMTFAGLQPIPGPPLAGFAEAGVDIQGPGFRFQEGFSVTDQTPGLSIRHTFSHPVSVAAGSRINVYEYARGAAVGQWTAIADPTFEIDPTATFQHQGATLRYADAFAITYSQGLLLPEPTTASLLGLGLFGLAAFRRRPDPARRDTA